MTKEEVIKIVNENAVPVFPLQIEYQDWLTAMDMVVEAFEKQIPKTPTYDGDGYAPDGTFVWDEWICPSCGERYEVDYDDYKYCPNCGQAIDWSEEI